MSDQSTNGNLLSQLPTLAEIDKRLEALEAEKKQLKTLRKVVEQKAETATAK